MSQLDGPVNAGDLHLSAQQQQKQIDRKRGFQVIPIPLEARIRQDLDLQIEIARLSAVDSGNTLSFQTDPGTGLDPARNFGLNLAAVFPFQHAVRSVKGIIQRDLKRMFLVAAGSRSRLSGKTVILRAGSGSSSPSAAEEVFKKARIPAAAPNKVSYSSGVTVR